MDAEQQAIDKLKADGYRLVSGSTLLYEKGDSIAYVTPFGLTDYSKRDKYTPERVTMIVETQGASPATINAPRGGTCARVWEIADELKERDAVVAKCIEEGINKSTTQTQFARWRKQHADDL